jgi:hypothetical protein
MNATDTTAMRPLLFPDDQQFWYETLRALGHTAYGGADIGEVVTTAARISAGDYDSWYAPPRNGTTSGRWPPRSAATPSSPSTGRASPGPATATG